MCQNEQKVAITHSNLCNFQIEVAFFLSYALKFWCVAAKSNTDSSTWQGDRQFPETWTGITSVKWVHNRDRLKHVPVTAKSLMGGKMSTWLSSILNKSHTPPRGNRKLPNTHIGDRSGSCTDWEMLLKGIWREKMQENSVSCHFSVLRMVFPTTRPPYCSAAVIHHLSLQTISL